MLEDQTTTQRSHHKEENWQLIRESSQVQRKAERLLESLLESGPRGSGLGEVTV
jgi:hypothetical protein